MSSPRGNGVNGADAKKGDTRTAPSPDEDAGAVARVARGIALYGTLGVSSLFVLGRCEEANVREHDRVTFGTIDSPRFTVRVGWPGDVVRPAREGLSAAGNREPRTSGWSETTMVSTVETICAEAEGVLKAQALRPETFERLQRASAESLEGEARARLELEAQAPVYWATCGRLRELTEALSKAARVRHDALAERGLAAYFARATDDDTSAPATPIPPIDYAKDIFAAVTGRALPNDVAVQIAPIDDVRIAGLANSFWRSVTVAPQLSYPEMISTLLHEFGHLVARPGEDPLIKRGHLAIIVGGPAPEVNRERILEEAAAYAFERCAIAAIPDDGVRRSAAESFEVQAVDLIERYFMGDGDVHSVGFAVVEAAVEVLGDSAAAYRYLSTTRELSPAIERGIESLRAAWAATPAGQLFTEKAGYRKAADRFIALLERYDPTFRRERF